MKGEAREERSAVIERQAVAIRHFLPCIRSKIVKIMPFEWANQRNTNPASIAGRFAAFAAIQPVMYIHCVTRVSFA